MYHYLKAKKDYYGRRIDTSRRRRNFVNSSKYIKVGDRVLITVPEDMHIHGNIDPVLDGQIGIVKHIDGEVEVILQNKESVFVPAFCLCLEDTVLYPRLKEASLQRKDSCPRTAFTTTTQKSPLVSS